MFDKSMRILLAVIAILGMDVLAFQPTAPSRDGRTLAARQSTRSPEEQEIALQKATKAMTAFTNKYLENTCTKLCSDKSVPAVVIKGLAEHKITLGAPLCPCRFYDDKEAEAKDGYW
jgi:ferredoxin-thioredoxin reductase catalytic chain